MKAVIGISCCQKPFDPLEPLEHAASDTYVRAVSDFIGACPILIPASGGEAEVASLLAILDGLILTGSQSNLEPTLYGGDPHPPDTPEDKSRDGITLPLIRAAIAAGVPLLGICRGFQELNVALGGSLHQQLRNVPGRMNHWRPLRPLAELRRKKAHAIQVVPGSWLHQVAGSPEIVVNSFHEQGIDRLAADLVAEGFAPDGTIEAVRVTDSRSFAVGVQWHPEYDIEANAISQRIFESFGAAVAICSRGERR